MNPFSNNIVMFYFCLCYAVLSVTCSLWSPVWKRLTSWLSFVLIHIRTIGEVGNVKPSTPIFYFTDRSKAVLLLWILFVIYVLSVSLFCCLVCSLQICHHLVGKGCPLGSLVCDVFLCFDTFPYGAMAFNFDLSESYQLTCAIRLAPVLKTFFPSMCHIMYM